MIRYDFMAHDGGDIVESEDGDYVKYDEAKAEIDVLTMKLKHKGIACDEHDLVGGWACPRCLDEAKIEVDRLKDMIDELQGIEEFRQIYSCLAEDAYPREAEGWMKTAKAILSNRKGPYGAKV